MNVTRQLVLALLVAWNESTTLSFVESAVMLPAVFGACAVPLPDASVAAAKLEATGREMLSSVNVGAASVGSMVTFPATITMLPTLIYWNAPVTADAATLVVLVSVGVYVPAPPT